MASASWFRHPSLKNQMPAPACEFAELRCPAIRLCRVLGNYEKGKLRTGAWGPAGGPMTRCFAALPEPFAPPLAGSMAGPASPLWLEAAAAAGPSGISKWLEHLGKGKCMELMTGQRAHALEKACHEYIVNLRGKRADWMCHLLTQTAVGRAGWLTSAQ